MIHDGDLSFDKFPSAEDIQILQEFADEDDDEEDDYDDELDDSDREEIKEELEDLKDNDDDEEVYGGDKVEKNEAEEEIIGADEDIEEVRVGIKRPREKNEQIIDRRYLKRQNRALFQKYYSGTYYWKCCSWIMYKLHQSLNKENNDSLWLWILGMTDLLVHQRSGSYSFDNDMIDCNQEVHRLNPHIYSRQDDDLDNFENDNPQQINNSDKDPF